MNSEPVLILVTLNYMQAREFCKRQGINYDKVISFATDSSIRPQCGRYLTDDDGLVWYGPWTEGFQSHEVVDVVYSLLRANGNPFEYTAYMYDEAIPWPASIAERYLL